ncbi:MAG: glycosyl hydrolase family 28 protein [Bacilli bacterium]
MKKFRIFLISFLIVFLSACTVNNDFSSQSSSNEYESIIEKEYEKDDDGFYILEEDYFSNKGSIKGQLDYSNKLNEDIYASSFRLFCGDKEIPVYHTNTNPNRVWSANPQIFVEAGVAIINLDGEINLSLQTNFAFKELTTRVMPGDKHIEHEKDYNRRVVNFKISELGQYTISFLKNYSFHLFVNPIDGYASSFSNNKTIVFEKGIHDKNNSSYIGSNNLISLSSNTTVILEKGAVLKAGFIANSASNIEIIGDGIVLGADFERNGETGSKLIPFEFNYCSNIIFKGITTLDPAGWCYNLYFSNQVLLEDIKIISSRSNGDGVSVQSCQNVICKNSFVRTWDDSLVVKNYPKWSNRNEQGTTKNIVFEKCQIWTDLAQSMELGYETVGLVFEDIYFKDITVLFNYHKAVISIHNANNAYIKNVHFENITIENARMGCGDGVPYLIDIQNLYSSTWSTNHATTSLGFIESIYINNVLVLSNASKSLINISGCLDNRSGFNNTEEHFVKDININNVYIDNEYLTDNSSLLNIGNYVYNLSISHNDEIVTGANSYFD